MIDRTADSGTSRVNERMEKITRNIRQVRKATDLQSIIHVKVENGMIQSLKEMITIKESANKETTVIGKSHTGLAIDHLQRELGLIAPISIPRSEQNP
mmetsp:Transcript_12581/g.17684  ORF Transcript_12581/g.17684 Transcript_12581/m.17684 type:complete len:98 (+) Transcript_12581:379-672(+)